MLIAASSIFVSAADYRNAYVIIWDGDACDNLRYAKNMGYDYVGYQYGMEDCMDNINMYFYLESPDQNLKIRGDFIYFNREYNQEEKKEYNDLLLWKSNASFPNNIATGWFFSENFFRPLADFQQQRVIDLMVNRSLLKIKQIEDTNKNFRFGGWSWDVPSLKGDLWSGVQGRELLNRTGTGKQVDISYWTGTCSGVKHSGLSQDYACYTDGKAAFYKKLFSETRKEYPDMKIYMEPYTPWHSYISEIASRSDVLELRPDLLCQEKGTLDFVNDTRLFAPNLMTKDKVCSDTPDVYDHKGNLVIAGNAGINGAWFLWYGRFGGTGNFPRHESIRDIPDRLKLIRAVPGWDNLNDVSLSTRSWNATKLEYKSSKSLANMNIIYSTHPKNKKIYFVILNRSQGISLQGKAIDTIYSVDELFSAKNNASSHFNEDNGVIYLKSNSYVGKGYILTLKNIVPQNSSNSFNSTNITPEVSCTDTDLGKNIFIKGGVFGIDANGSAFNYNDYCYIFNDNARIKEFYCQNEVFYDEGYTCEHGCQNGACLSSSNVDDVNTSISSSLNITNSSSNLDESNVEEEEESNSKSSSTSTEGINTFKPLCGDNICTNSHESCSSCSADCGNCLIELFCGDNICTSSHESCSSCSEDCGNCMKGEVVDSFNSIGSNFEEELVQKSNLNTLPELIESSNSKEEQGETNILTGFLTGANRNGSSKFVAGYVVLGILIFSLVALFITRSISNKAKGLDSSKLKTFASFSKHYPVHAQAIVKYIREARKANRTTRSIKQELVESGWPEHIVDMAILKEESGLNI
ncbi:MAG: hypothetical protein ACP5N2_02085 [Candidatus Nanoarchaeia archaeon]